MPGPTESYWVASEPGPDFPAQGDDLTVDVVVIGGGIVGVTTATMLKDMGKTVALIEARRFIEGATGYTTAKLTSSHNLIYAKLFRSFGRDGARIYGEANEAGLQWVAERVHRDGIDCGFERRPNFVYATDPDRTQDLVDEAGAARDAGLPASFVEECDLPFQTAGAVRFEEQAQFHPRAFLLSLLQTIPGDGSHAFAQTKAVDLDENGVCTVTTDRGVVTALDVVIATHLPVFDRGLFFTKAHPYCSYAVAGPVSDDAIPEGMYISADTPTRSIRSIPSSDGRLLLIGGNGHHVGDETDTEHNYRELEDMGTQHWGVADFPYRWSTHDYISVDKVPYVGRFTRTSDHVYTATGFGKWGMAAGVAAGMIISDALVGRENPWAAFFDAKRVHPSQLKSAVVENAKVGVHFFADRFPTGGSPDDLGPDQGGVFSTGIRQVAAFRDAEGELTKLSALCTHLGCVVRWNSADRSFDCPCHGSRFDRYGKVINGPANDDLKRL